MFVLVEAKNKEMIKSTLNVWNPSSKTEKVQQSYQLRASFIQQGNLSQFFVLLGDFNVQENKTILSEFLNAYNAKNIVKNKTCFKSIENPSCVELIITDKPGSFQHTNVYETGISVLDHHKLVTTVMKAKFTEVSSKYVHYRNYKNFNE